ncbi:MAG: hypothetical protein LBQ60_06560 [Bacteroidales bacterium]|nr:hypothetical protein [Bacteroidales bacterium]
MKKIALFILAVAACLASCKSGFDNISDYATEETVYPGKYDTCVVSIGYNRLEIDLLQANFEEVDGEMVRKETPVPSDKIFLGKASQTVVEVEGENELRVLNGLFSRISVDGLNEARLYRIKIYTRDEFGNVSVPQEAAEVPFTDADIETYDDVPEPKISPSPFSATLSWSAIATPMMEYAGLKYGYYNENGEFTEGEVPGNEEINFNMQDLVGEKDYSVDVYVRIIPIRGEIPIVDTIDLKRTYHTTTLNEADYIAWCKDKMRKVINVGWTTDATVFFETESDPTQILSIIKYEDKDGNNQEITALRADGIAVLPGAKYGSSISIHSIYQPSGSTAEVPTDESQFTTLPMDDFNTIPGTLLFIDRRHWKTVYTHAGGLSTDGKPDPGYAYQDAHIDNNIESFMGMSKRGKESNKIDGGNEMGFIIDMKHPTLFNSLLWAHREQGYTENSNNLGGLWWWGVDVWGTNEYLGPVNKYENVSGTVNDDPNTQWTFIKRLDFCINEDGTPTANNKPRAFFTPALEPTSYQRQLPLFNLDGNHTYRYIKVQSYKFDAVNNNKACVADFRLYYKEP